MRGGMTLDEAFALGSEERELVAEIAKENFETTKKTQLPYF